MFPSLPSLPGFLPNDPCGLFPDLPGCTKTTTPGIGLPPTVGGGGGVTLPGGSLPPIVVGLPGGSGPSAGNTVTLAGTTASGIATSFLSNPIGYLFGTSLTRIAFFILGLIFIIMGLYMLKETKFLIQVPLNAAKSGVKTVTEAAAAA